MRMGGNLEPIAVKMYANACFDPNECNLNVTGSCNYLVYTISVLKAYTAARAKSLICVLDS